MNNADLLLALNIVDEDHQLVLHKMQALKEAVSLLLEPGSATLPRALQRLRELHAFFIAKFESHMKEEETALFPQLERTVPDGTGLAARLRDEHKEIRRRCKEFGNSLAYAAQLDDDLPRAVIRDLLRFGWDFWDYLDQHAQTETHAVRKCLAKTLESEGRASNGAR
jgi:hemerythrin-like domain-containing protein